MGRTSKPLTIFVLPSLDDWEEFKALAAQGHDIRRTGFPEECDLVLGPNAWRMNEQLRRYLPLAIAEARKRRYGKDSDDSSSV
jgi:hypothetical protein